MLSTWDVITQLFLNEQKMLVSFWFHFKRGPSKGNAWIVLIRGTFYKSMPHKSYMKVSHKGWSYRRPNLTR